MTPPPGTPDADMGAGTAPAAVKSSDGNTAILSAAAGAVADQNGNIKAKVGADCALLLSCNVLRRGPHCLSSVCTHVRALMLLLVVDSLCVILLDTA